MSAHTHTAVVNVAPGALLETISVPTLPPEEDEVLVKVEWTCSGPLDLHQGDGGLLVQQYPHILGDSSAGTVVSLGPNARNLKVGDKVFGFQWRSLKEKTQQEFIVTPEWLLGKIPAGVSAQEAVTVPDNLVTAFNTLSADLQLPTPWPKPANYISPRARDPILVWGAASSVGQYTLQILRYYGYKYLIAVASPTHHDYLKDLGAAQVFSYRDSNVVDSILEAEPSIPLIIDCIGSLRGSLEPISKIAKNGSRVAVMLPVIVSPASKTEPAKYSMDVTSVVQWVSGVEPSGVRTHFYLTNELFKEKLQMEIMPYLLAEGFVKPNRYRVIEGLTVLERAQNAMNALRNGVSGERLVWRVTEG